MWERSCIAIKGSDRNIKFTLKLTPIAFVLQQRDREREVEDVSKHSAPPPLHPSQPLLLLSRINLVIIPPSSSSSISPSFDLKQRILRTHKTGIQNHETEDSKSPSGIYKGNREKETDDKKYIDRV